MRNNTDNTTGRDGIFQDWRANRGNFKGQLICVFFRIASLARSHKVLTVLLLWYLIFYRFFVEWFLNIEIHWNVRAGKGLMMEHGHGTVINGSAVLGEFCTVRHLTTIGNKKLPNGTYSRSPHIGNHVDIGANVSIIGDITIGDNVIIGVGSVVTKNVPSNCIVVGNPARILRNLETVKQELYVG
jgi:putative colanic acid biosynthesis acetyltransferase WcaB